MTANDVSDTIPMTTNYTDFEQFVNEHMKPIMFYKKYRHEANSTLPIDLELKPRQCSRCEIIDTDIKYSFKILDNNKISKANCNRCNKTINNIYD